MVLIKWDDLPYSMKNSSVKRYYDCLAKKRKSLVLKRSFDLTVGLLLLIILSPLFLILALLIKIDSVGPVMFRQIRVTQYNKQFRIFKFRTMIANAEKAGTLVTTSNDKRITRIGGFLRKYRLDEIPQLLNIIRGDMSFVGTRPEVCKYTSVYTEEMMATLLLPAGVTSLASISFRDEDSLINGDNVDEIYVKNILPDKMRFNLAYLEEFSFSSDIAIMFNTVFSVFGKNESERKSM